MKLINLDDLIRPASECGCGFSHDKTLEAVLIGDLESGVKRLGNLGLSPPYAVFYDKVTYEIAGGRVAEILDAEAFLVKEPTFCEAEEKSGRLGERGTVIAVGGGTVIDVAKYAAYKRGLSFVSIPTAPSHDGIVSPIASLFTQKRRKSVLTRSPRIALIDPKILASAPRELAASGYGDILAKLVSIKDWQLGRDELGEAYCTNAEELVMKAVDLVIKALTSERDPEKRLSSLTEALIYSGAAMMIVGSSRPASGSEHLISHYLDMNSEKRLKHGIQCALGAMAMAAYHQERNPNWWTEEKYRLEALRKYSQAAGIPIRLSEAGIPSEIMVEAIVEAWKIRPNRYTILHKFKPSRVEALEILEKTGLI